MKKSLIFLLVLALFFGCCSYAAAQRSHHKLVSDVRKLAKEHGVVIDSIVVVSGAEYFSVGTYKHFAEIECSISKQTCRIRFDDCILSSPDYKHGIKHEVAHAVAILKYNDRGHGQDWRKVMRRMNGRTSSLRCYD